MKNRNRDSYHFDDDDEIEDGHSVRVPMMIMDGNRVNLSDTVRFEGGQPHFARMADTASESSIEDLESPRDLDALRDAARAARDAWIKQTCEAWRTPSRDAAEPDLGSRPEEVMRMRRHLRGTEEEDDAAALREKSYAAYKDRLSNAWRGRTDPRAATAIERQGERWRGGR
jgi:hypothetical protein